MAATGAASTILELRQYTLQPGRRDELIELFEREFIEAQEAAGIELAGLFRDARRPDRFVWIRGFAGMESRRTALAEFYGGPCWRTHRDAANATMIDSDDVLLLRHAANSSAPIPSGSFRGPLLAATYLFADDSQVQSFANGVAARWNELLTSDGGTLLAILVTEHAANTFPQLPVREGEHAVVLLIDGIEPERLALQSPAPSDVIHLVPTSRSRMRLTHTGKRGDFDFLSGEWNVVHRKLRSRLSHCDEWLTETGTYRGYSLADGLLSVDEFDFPSTGVKGCSIRTLDLASQRWTIHWTTSATGRLFTPVHGGFASDRGEFYGYDLEGQTPVLARFIWSECGSDHPRWQQAFSTDGGATWETNWTMEFSSRLT